MIRQGAQSKAQNTVAHTHTHSQTHLLRKKNLNMLPPRAFPLLLYPSLCIYPTLLSLCSYIFHNFSHLYYASSLLFLQQPKLLYTTFNVAFYTFFFLLYFLYFILFRSILSFFSSFSTLTHTHTQTHIAGTVKWESSVAHQHFIFTRMKCMKRAFRCYRCCFVFLTY